jgi:26S proteasome regulatory subunit N2
LGGRNLTIKMVSNTGNNKLGSIVGMALFTQYYYWFPMVHFINLAAHPCMMLGVDSSLKIVKNYTVLSKTKPSIYGYPKEVILQEKKKEEKAPTAVLSTQSRVKAKQSRRTGTLTSIPDITMEDRTTSNLGRQTTTTNIAEKTEEEKKKEEEDKKKEEEVPEPNEEVLSNPCRILPKQVSVIERIPNQDYQPLINNRYNGFVLLKKVNENAVPEYFGEEVRNVNVSDQSNNVSQPQNNNYQAVPTHDVEMPEEFDIKDINK